MNKSTIFAFLIGAAAGAGGSWYYFKRKYERIAQEEIDSVKERFSNSIHVVVKDGDKKEEAPKEQKPAYETKPDIMDYAKRLSTEGYRKDYSNLSNEDEDEDDKETAPPPPQESYTGAKTNYAKDPYVISPDEFGEYDDYSKISLTYYADNMIADDNDEPLEDVEGTIGWESLMRFGEYEDDALHVRNERLKVDYEILKDLRKYSDVLEDKPYLRRS